MKPEDIFSKVYDILVEHAGAKDDPGTRETFIRYYLNDTFQGTEFRFQGHLGFGGKFYRDSTSYYIKCYREDSTPEREAIIEKVNELLRSLPYHFPTKPG